MKRCVRIRVTGTVQGVGYRAFLKKHATKLSLEGIVQNNEDGSVVIHICGPSDNLDDFIDFLYKGTKETKIKNVVVEPMTPDKNFRGIFRVIGEA